MVSGRIALKLGGEYRLLASYALEEDGSLYLFLIDSVSGEAASPTRNTSVKKISYHASGVVRYHYCQRTLFREPLCAISKINPVVARTIPSIHVLGILDEVQVRDLIYEIAQDGTIEFSFCVAPWQQVPAGSHFAIRFNKLFAVTIEVATVTESVRETKTIAPQGGLPAALIDEPTAFSRFHQRLHETQGLVIYSPNANGEYRIICAVPMRIPPRLEIQFVDKSYVAEQLEPHPKRGTAEVRFRVRNKSGYLKQEVPITSLALHAEL